MKVEILGVSQPANPNLTRIMASLRFRVNSFPAVAAHFAWKAHILELALVVGSYLLYMGSRGLVFSDLDGKGLENAARVASAEKWLGFFGSLGGNRGY